LRGRQIHRVNLINALASTALGCSRTIEIKGQLRTGTMSKLRIERKMDTDTGSHRLGHGQLIELIAGVHTYDITLLLNFNISQILFQERQVVQVAGLIIIVALTKCLCVVLPRRSSVLLPPAAAFTR
jgi:hypothetical protein